MNRICKILITALLAVGLFMTCTSCASIDNANETSDKSAAVTGEESLKLQVESFPESIEIHGYTSDEATEIYNAFVLNHPEYFWLSRSYTYYPADDGAKIAISYPLDIEKLRVMKKDLDAKVEEIVSAAKTYVGDYERALFVHDYIIENCTYAIDMFDTVMDADVTEFFAENTAYGCLLEGSALCGGYAGAYLIIMKKLDQECMVVSGTSTDTNISHGWNIVKMDGDYYHVDVTWDDPVTKSESNHSNSYTYFGITTAEALETRTIDDAEEVPSCTATRDNYFVHEGYYLETYSFDACSKILKNQFDTANLARVKFGSEAELDRAYEDLFTNRRIQDVVPASKLSYLADNKVLTIAQ